jgi:hypothetical protein
MVVAADHALDARGGSNAGERVDSRFRGGFEYPAMHLALERGQRLHSETVYRDMGFKKGFIRVYRGCCPSRRVQA